MPTPGPGGQPGEVGEDDRGTLMSTFVVETGAGLTNANSYCTVAEADTYWGNNGNPTTWVDDAASQTLQFYAQPAVDDVIEINGTVEYVWKAVLSGISQVLIGADIEESIRNLAAAINLTGQRGVWYASDITENADVTATAGTDTLVVTAKVGGIAGNTISVATDMSNPNRWLGDTLEGGYATREEALRIATAHIDTTNRMNFLGEKTKQEQALEWPRAFVNDASNFCIRSDIIPQRLKDATAWFALQYMLDGDLLPNQSSTDTSIKAQSVKVGPIAKSTTYGSSGKTNLKKYRVGNELLLELVDSPGKIRYAG